MSRFSQSLLEDPNVVEVAASMGMTPEQYLQSILDKPQSPVLENLESGPRMDTGPTVATQPALTPGVPGEGVIAAPVANPADAPTSYADMSPQEFQSMAQNPAGVPAGAEFPGLGADFSGIERFDSAMEERTQAARQGIDQGVLQQQAAAGDARALAELERRKNVSQGPDFAQLEAQNSQSPALQAPVDFATLEAQNSKSPVLINTTTPAPTTNTNTVAPQSPVLGGSVTSSSRSPILSRGAGNMTANARGSALGMVPRGESLIRIGGAMYSGALQGDGIGAATREYGSIQDANRAAEVAAAKQAEATRLAELRANRVGAGKAGSKATKGAGDLRFGISKLQTALDMIRASDGSLTGLNPSALFDRFLGKTIGNEQEAQRLFLNEIGLDSIMKRVAETKGAISNAEMALFGRQVPQLGSQEIVWERWLQRQMQMAEILLARAEGGGTVDPNAPLSETMPGLSGGGGAGSSNMSAADAIVGI
jgi:hypothetical protein